MFSGEELSPKRISNETPVSQQSDIMHCIKCTKELSEFEKKQDYGKAGYCLLCHVGAITSESERAGTAKALSQCRVCGKDIVSTLQETYYATQAEYCWTCYCEVMERFRGLYNEAHANKFSSVEQVRGIVTFLKENHLGVDAALAYVRDSLILYIERNANDQISNEAVEHIAELEKQVGMSPELVHHVDEEIQYLKSILDVKKGRLPTAVPTIILPAGEIMHYEAPTEYSDDGVNQIKGTMFVTNQRIIFRSPQKRFDLPHYKIIQVTPCEIFIDIQLSTGSGSGYYNTPHNHLVSEIIEWLAKTASRQTLASPDGASRVIPQEIKIEVWQRDQGRCVECGAQEYLEFDHVIPFSMGGATSVNNLQLLCRKCNSSKRARL